MNSKEYDQIEEAANRLQHEASVKCSNVNLKEELSEQAAAEFLTKRMNLPARREEETGWKKPMYSIDTMLQRRKAEGIARLEEIERVLGIKFEKWQKEYILSRGLGYPIEGRNTGRTLAHQVKTLMKSEDDIIIYPHQRWMYPDVHAGMKNTEYYAKCYVKELRELSEKLRNHGINVPRVIEMN